MYDCSTWNMGRGVENPYGEGVLKYVKIWWTVLQINFPEKFCIKKVVPSIFNII